MSQIRMDSMNILHRIARSSELIRLRIIPAAFLLTVAGSVSAQTSSGDSLVFEVEQRSTLETIRFRSIAEDVLSDTVIEGGLSAPAGLLPGAECRAVYYLRASSLSMYFCMASSLDMPLHCSQASYLARPTKSIMPGRLPDTSPAVPCLYRA